jgi:RimJ/RimL family protein N-acetyltransferase
MIRGKTIVLTELRSADSATLFNWINSPDTVHFNAPYTPIHEPNHTAWFEAVTNASDRVVFAIREPPTLRLIGIVQLVGLHPIHRTAELIIRIGEESDRNRGAGSEAVQLATNFAFMDRNLQRVWLRAFTDNPRAIRAYEKAGFKMEGTMRRACFIDGRWRDEAIMAILRPLDDRRQ